MRRFLKFAEKNLMNTILASITITTIIIAVIIFLVLLFRFNTPVKNECDKEWFIVSKGENTFSLVDKKGNRMNLECVDFLFKRKGD